MVYSKYVVTLLLGVLLSLPLEGQHADATSDPCGMPLLSNSRNDQNLFNEQQEEWLGDAMDQSIRKDFHAIEDPDGYLQRIGERLLAQLPPTTIHYHFVIVDSPGLNSFGLAGGRIYIYRRMVAFAKSEDELTALLGHEIGHMVTHQVAIHMSGYFRELGINSVSDRQDVFNKWEQFRDNSAKIKKGSGESTEQREQLIADRIGLYAMMRAGYDPAKYVEFADRSFETKGKTGGFWSDFFGATSPESKRLREIVRNSTPLPAGCIQGRPDTSSFARWQQSIIQAKVETAKEELPGLMKKIVLQPPLRNELTYLQFSPDGKYLLAQDDSSIFVLAREPLANLFRIDALEAQQAQFTPDSSSVVFNDKEMRVQKWDIAGRSQVFIRELPSDCKDSLLSPTGEAMACVRPDRELQIIDVKNGEVLFAKKNFFELTASDMFLTELIELLAALGGEAFEPFKAQLQFSRDGRYLVAARGDYSLGYDLKTRSEVKLPGKVRSLIRSPFVFIADDEIFGITQDNPRKATLLRFPTGDSVDQFIFPGSGQFSPAVKANYVMMRSGGMAAIVAIDLTAKKITLGYKTPGFAIYDNVYAGDDVEGLITLYRLSDKSEIAHIRLPSSPLAGVKASAFSSDGNWLAVSGRTRAALWKLETGNQVGFSRDFDGAFFDKDKLIVRFPKRLKEPGQIASITPSPLSFTKLYELEPADDGHPAGASPGSRTRTWQDDDLLVRLEPTDAKKFDRFTLDVRDVRNNTPLWQLQFDKHRPSFYYLRSGQTITFLVGDYEKIKEAAKHDGALNAKVEAIGKKQGKQDSYLLQVVDARSQKALGNVLVDTGNLSFYVKRAVAAGENVFVSDSLNRTLVYALKSGTPRGKVSGTAIAVSGSGDKVLVENGSGNVDLYDAVSLRPVEHFAFPSRIAHAEFTGPDHLMVLTADQTVYQINLAGGPENAGVH